MALPKGSAATLNHSVRLYHGDAERNHAMDRLYARFLQAGDLAFDIGAHVGDRTSSFRRIGARVVALEPQPGPARVIRLLHGLDPHVTLLQAAAGSCEEEIVLHVNTANPAVSTASTAFICAANGATGWEGQVWDETMKVPCLTLDGLIRAHGRPQFIKIDVEGFEEHVLCGLSEPVPALSFEFTTIARKVAQRCIGRLSALGPYRFDVALGETQRLTFGQWIEASEMATHLSALPHAANSGDVYAALAQF